MLITGAIEEMRAKFPDDDEATFARRMQLYRELDKSAADIVAGRVPTKDWREAMAELEEKWEKEGRFTAHYEYEAV